MSEIEATKFTPLFFKSQLDRGPKRFTGQSVGSEGELEYKHQRCLSLGTEVFFHCPKSSLAMPSVTYAANVFFLRRDNFFASEGRVQAFRRIDDDRGNLLLQYAEARLDFCPLQLSLRLLEFNCHPQQFANRWGWPGSPLVSQGVALTYPAVVGIYKTLEPTEYIHTGYVQGVTGRLHSLGVDLILYTTAFHAPQLLPLYSVFPIMSHIPDTNWISMASRLPCLVCPALQSQNCSCKGSGNCTFMYRQNARNKNHRLVLKRFEF